MANFVKDAFVWFIAILDVILGALAYSGHSSFDCFRGNA
jgi:hypothetical protein